jgi:hypothetical protein
MRLYYSGGEVLAWRKLFAAEGISDIALSFYGLSRRLKNTGSWLLADKFPGNANIFLDSGAYSLNKPGSEVTWDEAATVAENYMEFIRNSIERVEMVSEFDARIMGNDYIELMRRTFYDDLGDKFIPVWHADNGGLDELERLASTYSRVAVTESDIGGRDLTPVLNNLVGRYGVKLHGASLTRMELMKSVRWESVGSTSWMSPAHYGDTIVWTGNELKRYPVRYREQARKRHRTLFDANGFSAEKIAADDRTEVLRLSLWSWQHFIADINTHSVTSTPNPGDADNAQDGTGDVDNTITISENGELRIRRASEPIPVAGFFHKEDSDEVLFRSRSESMRMCNTCFLRGKCPGYEADANCLYNIPIKVRTEEEMRAVQDALIEMQTQRVLFMQMAEQIEGGYADPNLSSEMDRLQRMIKAKRDADQVKIVRRSEESARGSASAMADLFGMPRQEQPVQDADTVIGEIMG